MSFAVRTSASPGDIIAGVRRAVGEVDYRLPLIDVTTMEGQIDEAVAQERLFAWAVSLFSSITLVLACVGLYGLVSYSLASRTREIGVRVALGADRPAVIGIIARQVAATALAGAGLGVPAAVALARIIESRLFGVKPYDPASVAISAITIAAVGVIAAFLPARRALRIDPVSALRCE